MLDIRNHYAYIIDVRETDLIIDLSSKSRSSNNPSLSQERENEDRLFNFRGDDKMRYPDFFRRDPRTGNTWAAYCIFGQWMLRRNGYDRGQAIDTTDAQAWVIDAE